MNFAHRQCFSTLRLKAIFSPTSVHTGFVSTILARSALTALTRPPVDSEPMFTISTSFFDSFWTCGPNQIKENCYSFQKKCKGTLKSEYKVPPNINFPDFHCLKSRISMTYNEWKTRRCCPLHNCKIVWAWITFFINSIAIIRATMDKLPLILEKKW